MPLFLPPVGGVAARMPWESEDAAGAQRVSAEAQAKATAEAAQRSKADAELAQCIAEQEVRALDKKREEDRKAFIPEIHKALEFYGFNIRGEAYRNVNPIYVETALNALADELALSHGTEWDFHPTSSTRHGSMVDSGQEQVLTKLANHDPSLPHSIYNLQQKVFSALNSGSTPPTWLPLYEIPEWAGPPGDSAGHIWKFENGFWNRLDVDPVVYFVPCDPVTFVPEKKADADVAPGLKTGSIADRAAEIEAARETARQVAEETAIIEQQAEAGAQVERQVRSSKLKTWSLVGAGAAALGLTALLLSRRSS